MSGELSPRTEGARTDRTQLAPTKIATDRPADEVGCSRGRDQYCHTLADHIAQGAAVQPDGCRAVSSIRAPPPATRPVDVAASTGPGDALVGTGAGGQTPSPCWRCRLPSRIVTDAHRVCLMFVPGDSPTPATSVRAALGCGLPRPSLGCLPAGWRSARSSLKSPSRSCS